MSHKKKDPEPGSGETTFNREGIFGGESEGTISREEKEENDPENTDEEDKDEEAATQSGKEGNGKGGQSQQNKRGKSSRKDAPKDSPAKSF